MLVHHRGDNGEMQRRHSAVIQRLWIKLCFDRWGVINDPQMRAACEQTKVAWMLWRRRLMQKLRWIAFYASIDVVGTHLAFIDPQRPCWRRAFEQGAGCFGSRPSAS